MNRLLLAYRVLANVVGVLLVILVFVAIPLRHIFGHPLLSTIVSPLHGYLYLVYVLVSFFLCRRERVPVPRTLWVLGAGVIPFLTFIMERRMTRDLTAAAPVGSAVG